MRPIDADALKANINTAFWSEIEKIIDSAPTIEVPTWIPCSERLPKGADGVSECETVLMTFKEGFVASGWINGRHAYVLLPFPAYDQITVRQSKDVIAWMPLPQSYEETDYE